MRSLRAQRGAPSEPMLRRDPAPSRMVYRYQRLMLTPGFRRLLKVGVPVLIIGGLVAGWTAREANRVMISNAFFNIKTQIQHRDEFMVASMVVDGADEVLMADILRVLPVLFPISSFDLPLEEMRQTVAVLPAVAAVTLRVRSGGTLQVSVTQREPVAVFRSPDGLKLIDATGVLIKDIIVRADRSDLPLITGDGARENLTEGLEVYAAAGPLTPRMRGVVRMGERRWDVILDTGQRILLPTADPVQAFERVVALDQAQDLLQRDVSVVDMRHPARPTIRLNEPAVAQLRQSTAQQNQ